MEIKWKKTKKQKNKPRVKVLYMSIAEGSNWLPILVGASQILSCSPIAFALQAQLPTSVHTLHHRNEV